MQRDMGCIRHVLLEVERSDVEGISSGAIANDNWNLKTVDYHVALMGEAGLLLTTEYVYLSSQGSGVATPDGDDSAGDYLIHRLTWEGHEFLDSVRDDEVWQKVKAKLGRLGGFTMPIIQRIIGQVLLEAL